MSGTTTGHLTGRQSEIHSFLIDYQAAHQMPPTRAEIARHFGWASANAAEEHLRLIAAKGFIRLERGVARGIRILRWGSA